MSFGENVGFYRRQLDITQEELAERIFVSRQTVSRWETDSTFPDVETIVKLCDIFECDMDTLVRGSAENDEKRAPAPACDLITKMKEELKEKRLLNERIIGAVAAPAVLLSILIYLLCGFLGGIWHPAWLIFVGGVVIIATTAVVADAVIGVSNLQKKIRHEKRKIKKQEKEQVEKIEVSSI